MQIVKLLSSGPHMGITAAAAWALYAATQGNRPVALAAYSSGALQPLLDLIQGGGSQVLFLTSFSTHAGEALRVNAWFGKPFHRANTGVQISAGKTFLVQDQMSAADSHSMLNSVCTFHQNCLKHSSPAMACPTLRLVL